MVQHERSGTRAGDARAPDRDDPSLTSLPPDRARFTIIDPVGLGQNFAGFMHLADHDEALVGARIWTEAEQIEQRLADLTEHMETVIQKYLRNEFETIDEYNAQAGELAEPYRFLVIADFPNWLPGRSIPPARQHRRQRRAVRRIHPRRCAIIRVTAARPEAHSRRSRSPQRQPRAAGRRLRLER